ncbi:alternative ribosome rescue factor ArfA [Pseudomonas sp. NPDC078700]|uniref:alternative ribosome rescue factor ArfA n=1 Tax=Pseudomonas sp. NPDC078700 TaxID=3364424 RepID=UPI0037C99A66
MSKSGQKRPNKAKSIVAQPLFRSQQQKPQKGKGSYRRQASQQNWEACCVKAA